MPRSDRLKKTQNSARRQQKIAARAEARRNSPPTPTEEPTYADMELAALTWENAFFKMRENQAAESSLNAKPLSRRAALRKRGLDVRDIYQLGD